MNDAADLREVEALIQAYLDGSLTEPESGRLLTFLQREPALASVIMQNLRTDYLIRSVVAESALAVNSAAPENVIPMPKIEKKSQRPALRDKINTHWRAPLALAACVAFLLGLSIWYFGPTIGEPVLAEVKGLDVSIERGMEFVPGASGMRLQPADVVRVGTNASAMIMFASEKTQLELHADTELKLTSWSDAKHFTLRSGQLEASVARQRPFKPMLVRTPQAEARVLGTKFTLTVTTNSTQLDVDKGEVRLTRASDGARVDVPADHYALAASNAELAILPQPGWIFREYWTNLPGTRFELDLMARPSFPNHPDGHEWISRLETTNGWGDDYGARWRGYLHPPITGDYRLALAAADEGCFYLSKNDQPENKIQVQRSVGGSLENWNSDQDRRPNQFTLSAGRRYYIEALHKAGKGVDHLAVGWKRPDGKVEVISGEYLSPFKPKPKEKP